MIDGSDQCTARPSETRSSWPDPGSARTLTRSEETANSHFPPIQESPQELTRKLSRVPGQNMRREPESVPDQPKLFVFLQEGRVITKQGIDVGVIQLRPEIVEIHQESPADIALPRPDQMVDQMVPEIALIW